MSFLAKLFLEVNGMTIGDSTSASDDIDRGINVLRCSYEFRRSMDLSTGISQGRVQMGLIRLEIESTKSTGMLEWLLNNGHGKGSIIFHRRELENTKEKELEFEDASLIDYKESFNSVSSGPMITNLEIFARIFHMNDIRDFSAVDWTSDDHPNSRN